MSEGEMEPVSHVEETVTFHDASPAAIAEAPTTIDNSYAISGEGDVTLGDFLARPVRIQTYEWTPTTSFTHNFNPWDDFLKNPLVADKWKHYAYLKGNLHVKVVINGSPFYYGRSIIGYLPLDQANEPFDMLNFNAKPNERYSDECRVNYLSQCQCAYLDPSTSSSLEMELPFICPRNAMRLFAPGTKTAETTWANVTDPWEMGRIHIHQINPLRQGNTPEAAVDARVVVNVFAWMENAELSVPTDQRVSVPDTFKLKLKPQGKKVKVNMMSGKKEEEEAVEGKVAVSGIASAFEDSLSRLGSVPVIGPFATAGSIAAGAVARVAKVFGFSSPVQLADTHYYQAEPVPKFASTVGAYLGAKLAVDPLNEVVIDPRVGNCCPDDQLSIENIAGHESFLTSFEWAKRSGVSGPNVLFRCAVTPALYSIAPILDGVKLGRVMQPTSMAFASNPFEYWRGTLKVRFQVVASQYHRGRIAVVYEPNIMRQDSMLSVTGVEYNGRKVQIFDLQEFDGTEIEFPWAQSEMFCQVPSPRTMENSIVANHAYSPSYNNVGSYLFNNTTESTYANGFFEVVILNDLTGAIPDPPPIDINVYVSMPDLVVASPTGGTIGDPAIATPTLALRPQAEVVTGKFDHNSGMSTTMLPEKPIDQALAINFGENIRSFRTLLKRQQGIFTHANTADSDTSVLMNMYPSNHRYYATPTTSGLTYRNRNITNLFDYLRGAFVGMRGGYRWTAFAYKGNRAVNGYSANRYIGAPSEPGVFQGEGMTQPDHLGVHVAVQSANPAINIELPYYDTARFVSAQDSKFKRLDIFPQNRDMHRVKITTYKEASENVEITVAGAPADDFNFIGRVGAPCALVTWDP